MSLDMSDTGGQCDAASRLFQTRVGRGRYVLARVCVSRAHTILQVGRVQVTRGRQSSFRHWKRFCLCSADGGTCGPPLPRISKQGKGALMLCSKNVKVWSRTIVRRGKECISIADCRNIFRLLWLGWNRSAFLFWRVQTEWWILWKRDWTHLRYYHVFWCKFEDHSLMATSYELSYIH